MRMKFKNLLILLALFTLLQANAQKEDILKKHVSFLASKEMKGRQAHTEMAEKALQYIEEDLQKSGLQCKDFYLSKDSLFSNFYVVDDNEDTCHALYTVIESNATDKKDAYVVITAKYTGYGVDTLQGHELIGYSANDNASGTAVAMELAKMFFAERSNLKRGVIVLFTDDENTRPYAKYLSSEYKNIEAGFDLYEFGLQRKDTLGNYDEDYNNIRYNLTQRIKKISQIVTPLTINDLSIHSLISYYSGEESAIPFSYISGPISADVYYDCADSIDYEMMNLLNNQIFTVIKGVANSEFEIEELEDKPAFEDELSGLYNGFTNKYKHKSYFGINIMPLGDNSHYYEEGNMTGKKDNAFSAGIFYRWQFSSAWALRMDANYEYVKAKRHDGIFSSSVLSLPLSLALTTGGRPSIGLDIYAGGYYDYILNGKLGGKKLNFDDFKRYEWGFQWGLDIRLYRFILGYYCKIPWNNKMTDKYDAGRILENTSYFKLAFRF